MSNTLLDILAEYEIEKNASLIHVDYKEVELYILEILKTFVLMKLIQLINFTAFCFYFIRTSLQKKAVDHLTNHFRFSNVTSDDFYVTARIFLLSFWQHLWEYICISCGLKLFIEPFVFQITNFKPFP